MNEDEVEYVAMELARDIGATWPVGKESSPVVKLVRNRFRDRARVIIGALDRFRAARKAAEEAQTVHDRIHAESAEAFAETDTDLEITVGQTVMYRPPGDRRAIPCRVERIEDGQAYIVPITFNDIGWVPLEGSGPSQIPQGAKH